MKNKFAKIKLLLVAILLFSFKSFSQDIPKHNGTLVNDFANIIPDDQESDLRTLVKDYENKTSIQMCVVTITSLEGSGVEDYANTLFKTWGIGQKELNNGLLVLVSINDKKWRIEVGYGLEEWITDSYSKSVGEINFKPNFRKGDYYAGINMALKSFMSSLGDNGWAQRQELLALKKKQNDENFYVVMGWIVFFVFVMTLLIFGIFSYKRKQDEEKRRIELEQERKRIQEEIERKRLAKIKEAEQAIDLVNKKLDQTKKILNSFKEKYENCEEINSYNLELGKAEKQIEKMIQFKSLDKDYLSIIALRDSSINSFNLVEDGIQSNTKLSQEINQDFKNVDSVILDKKMTLNGVEKTLSKLHENYSEISKDPSESSLRLNVEKHLKDFHINILGAKHFIDEGKFSKAESTYFAAEKELNIADNYVKNASSFEQKVKSAASYLSQSKQTLVPIISLANKLSTNSDVSSETKSNLKSRIQSVEKFKPDSYNKNPLIGQKSLIELINDAEQTISKAKKEISTAEDERKRKEEEKRRKKRREEEEEESRRSSYLSSSVSSSYSSSSDYGSSSSSSDSSSSFGGGDSGGAGSSGDW